MAIGTVLIMIGAILETFTKRHTLGMFIAGRAIIGLGQGIALCKDTRPWVYKRYAGNADTWRKLPDPHISAKLHRTRFVALS